MHLPEMESDRRTRSSSTRTTSSDRVIVAVKAEKVIASTALAWALTHVVNPGDCITLLAVYPEEKSGRRRFWGFPRLKGGSRAGDGRTMPDQIGQISDSCSQMVLQLNDKLNVSVHIKVVSASPAGVVAAEAKENAAKWVILDKKLKLELKHCMAELNCNIVVMKGSRPKVLRLNLEWPDETQTPFYSAACSPVKMKLNGERMRHSTPTSSPESASTSFTRTCGDTNSISSPERGTSSRFLVYQRNPLYEKLYINSPSDTVRERIISLSVSSEILGSDKNRSLVDTQPKVDGLSYGHDSHRGLEYNSSIREAVSLRRTSSEPPPLCSMCRNKVPAFGKPPRRFLYEELEVATEGFSDKNLLAEGGFGLVYRGVLSDGLFVAVKELKYLRSEGDTDFCREVRVLSCAQHRNVVLLIGFCVEQRKRFLVYEYICNGSLDMHLHGSKDRTIEWDLRLKIAIGTARGLRYLHEDCRVGCIIHRDLRPHNILLTHDFEPLVADFGLARLHNEWELCEEEQIVGAIGYLAPEYFNGDNITEKVDVYAFGLVLLELITGKKDCASQYYNGQHFMLENFYLLAAMEQSRVLSDKQKLLDPRLPDYKLQNFPSELQTMCHAASLCLEKDPDLRPPMSKVLRILEGGGGFIPLALDATSTGSRSAHIKLPIAAKTAISRSKHSRGLSH